MAKLFELKKQREFALEKAENITATAERAKRELSVSESLEFDSCMTAVTALGSQIKHIEKHSTIYDMVGPNGAVLH